MPEPMRLLVLCFDPVTDAMAGPAVRAWRLAEVLAGAGHDVTLASTVAAEVSHPAMTVQHLADQSLADAAARADAVFAPTSVVQRHGAVIPDSTPLAVDMYIPTQLENLEPGDRTGEDRHRAIAHQQAVVAEDLRRGDFFVCANERQRSFWLGSLSAAGRVNPSVYEEDPTLRSLVDVVPFGVPGTDPPLAESHPLRERFPGIAPDDPVVVWGGGVYDWLDPLVAVRAVDRARRHVGNIRLVFLGMHNPHPAIPDMEIATRLRALSDRLGLTGVHVFFNETWVPYAQWPAFLADADLAVSAHLDHVETRFSSRTRVLDYIWAGLPMALSAGDELGDTVAARGLGYVVPPGDDDALADALVRLVAEGPVGRDFAGLARALAWPEVATPLVRWCTSPAVAADRRQPVAG